MIDIDKIIIPIVYNEDDCKVSNEELITDIVETLKEQLTKELIHKPIKCNIEFIYTSIINEPYGNNDSQNYGRSRKQSGD